MSETTASSAEHLAVEWSPVLSVVSTVDPDVAPFSLETLKLFLINLVTCVGSLFWERWKEKILQDQRRPRTVSSAVQEFDGMQEDGEIEQRPGVPAKAWTRTQLERDDHVQTGHVRYLSTFVRTLKGQGKSHLAVSGNQPTSQSWPLTTCTWRDKRQVCRTLRRKIANLDTFAGTTPDRHCRSDYAKSYLVMWTHG